ncbi:zinc finger domain-containing protein [Streptomyces ossamyceticus]|uniref:zinc finger domain-containing protein n=1 Tax=Streptomyces ossamyceticus TaxID=249581 RepID=UPI00343A128F
MSVAAHAAPQAAAHPEPPSAAAGARPHGGGHTVKVPLRLVVGAQYGDAALSVYVKIAALSQRAELCTARVETIAAYLGMSKSGVERALRELARPDTVDGLIEVPTRRRTYKDGRGQSAERSVRPLDADELWVRIPVRAAEALAPRLLRLYALLAYSAVRRIPVTVAELGEMLYHHTGARAGEHLGERQVRRLVDELAATGWLTVHRRQGERGRHAYETHRHPLHAVHGAPVIHDGSGPGDHDGSLASEEDHGTDRPDETQLGGGSRRRRGTGSKPATPASDLAAGTFGPGASRAPRGTHTAPAPTGKAPYGGPELRWTRRIHDSLAPVRHLLQDGTVSRFVLRRVAREIGHQLDQAAHNLMTPERMAARIAARYRDAGPIRDLGAWLLAVGIVPRGCGLPLCEDRHIWPTGEPCEACAVNRQITSEQWRTARAWQDRLTELRTCTAAVEGLPVKATYRQRGQASDAEVLAVAAAHGPAAALHRYGVLRAGELLRSHYGAFPAAPPVPSRHPVEEAPMPDDYMPDSFRAAIGRPAVTGALAIACPQAGCLAEPGHPCTSGRGRTRAPHEARTAAAPTRGEEPRA